MLCESVDEPLSPCPEGVPMRTESRTASASSVSAYEEEPRDRRVDALSDAVVDVDTREEDDDGWRR